MTEWWTYRLSDFLLFSADTYFRLFELYNQEIWPAHLPVLALSAFMVSLVFSQRKWAGQVLYILLAASWFWVAWGYHVRHFATINWVAPYYAAGFAVEGFLLLLFGITRKVNPVHPTANSRRWSMAIAGIGLIFLPVVGPVYGRPLTQIELWGLAPDPTAIVTIGLILSSGRLRWLLLPIPFLWCLISSATLWTMDTKDFLILPGIALLALVVAIFTNSLQLSLNDDISSKMV